MTIDPAHTATTATGYTPAPEVTYDAPASREVVPATPQAVGHDQVRVDVTEHPAWSIPGGLGLLCVLGLFLGGAGMVALGAAAGGDGGAGWQIALGGFLVVLSMLAGSSLTIVQPGETKVLQFLGRYVGTVRNTGIQLTLPFTDKSKVSVKVRNFETHELKVNDADGNPVNIAAIIVWQVADTAKSRFAVENYEHFVQVQAEAALRHVATTHPYDNAQPGEETLRGSTDLVAAELADEVAARVAIAGIEIVEARISSLAYAPEIAQAMLQRQQAAALLAARAMIVEGAVGMVESALRRLESDNIVAMDEVRKAEMVSNLLVVLCGETRATPVINTGYSTR
jgi:regulator of protease activity HflC (stomatin/prohibitin superfamily)